jgi:hypothetical protein
MGIIRGNNAVGLYRFISAVSGVKLFGELPDTRPQAGQILAPPPLPPNNINALYSRTTVTRLSTRKLIP